MTNIIDGRKLAAKHETALKNKTKKLKNKLKVVSVLIGQDEASVLYSDMKQKKAASFAIDFEIRKFPEDTTFEDVVLEIKSLNKDSSVQGLMIQLPIPKQCLDGHEAVDLLKIISPRKDVDGLTGKGKVLPAVVKAVLSILEDEKIKVAGSVITIIGASQSVGLPLAKELKKRGGKVTVCDINTRNLREETLRADILISATGVPEMVYGKMVTAGVVVIDVGVAKIDGKIVGDVDFASVAPLASKITPVPGGVGPMTVISLMENVIELAGGKS